MNGASTSLAIHTQRAFPERSEAGKNFPFCGKNFHGTAPQTGEENTRDGYELGDLDTRYHDMLRELRRWGITESDEAQRQSNAAAMGLVTSTSHHPDDRSGKILSDTTEQKKAA